MGTTALEGTAGQQSSNSNDSSSNASYDDPMGKNKRSKQESKDGKPAKSGKPTKGGQTEGSVSQGSATTTKKGKSSKLAAEGGKAQGAGDSKAAADKTPAGATAGDVATAAATSSAGEAAATASRSNAQPAANGSATLDGHHSTSKPAAAAAAVAGAPAAAEGGATGRAQAATAEVDGERRSSGGADSPTLTAAESLAMIPTSAAGSGSAAATTLPVASSSNPAGAAAVGGQAPPSSATAPPPLAAAVAGIGGHVGSTPGPGGAAGGAASNQALASAAAAMGFRWATPRSTLSSSLPSTRWRPRPLQGCTNTNPAAGLGAPMPNGRGARWQGGAGLPGQLPGPHSSGAMAHRQAAAAAMGAFPGLAGGNPAALISALSAGLASDPWPRPRPRAAAAAAAVTGNAQRAADGARPRRRAEWRPGRQLSIPARRAVPRRRWPGATQGALPSAGPSAQANPYQTLHGQGPVAVAQPGAQLPYQHALPHMPSGSSGASTGGGSGGSANSSLAGGSNGGVPPFRSGFASAAAAANALLAAQGQSPGPGVMPRVSKPGEGSSTSSQNGAPIARTTGTGTGARVPPFLTKLYTIMNEACPDDHATWCADGRAFRISDPQRFADHCLPRFFKHNKLGSFQQQLLTYGFTRVPNESCLDISTIWHHPKFIQGRPELLEQIQRAAGKSTKDDKAGVKRDQSGQSGERDGGNGHVEEDGDGNGDASDQFPAMQDTWRDWASRCRICTRAAAARSTR